jgi:hypothetical protein
VEGQQNKYSPRLVVSVVSSVSSVVSAASFLLFSSRSAFQLSKRKWVSSLAGHAATLAVLENWALVSPSVRSAAVRYWLMLRLQILAVAGYGATDVYVTCSSSVDVDAIRLLSSWSAVYMTSPAGLGV